MEKLIITKISWGKIELNGLLFENDVILLNDTVKKWDWKVFHTNHKEGIKVDEVVGYFSNGFNINKVVLSKGMQSMLNIHQDTIDFLKEQRVDFYLLETREAADIYNSLVEDGHNVLAFFHLTC